MAKLDLSKVTELWLNGMPVETLLIGGFEVWTAKKLYSGGTGNLNLIGNIFGQDATTHDAEVPILFKLQGGVTATAYASVDAKASGLLTLNATTIGSSETAINCSNNAFIVLKSTQYAISANSTDGNAVGKVAIDSNVSGGAFAMGLGKTDAKLLIKTEQKANAGIGSNGNTAANVLVKTNSSANAGIGSNGNTAANVLVKTNSSANAGEGHIGAVNAIPNVKSNSKAISAKTIGASIANSSAIQGIITGSGESANNKMLSGQLKVNKAEIKGTPSTATCATIDGTMRADSSVVGEINSTQNGILLAEFGFSGNVLNTVYSAASGAFCARPMICSVPTADTAISYETDIAAGLSIVSGMSATLEVDETPAPTDWALLEVQDKIGLWTESALQKRYSVLSCADARMNSVALVDLHLILPFYLQGAGWLKVLVQALPGTAFGSHLRGKIRVDKVLAQTRTVPGSAMDGRVETSAAVAGLQNADPAGLQGTVRAEKVCTELMAGASHTGRSKSTILQSVGILSVEKAPEKGWQNRQTGHILEIVGAWETSQSGSALELDQFANARQYGNVLEILGPCSVEKNGNTLEIGPFIGAGQDGSTLRIYGTWNALHTGNVLDLGGLNDVQQNGSVLSIATLPVCQQRGHELSLGSSDPAMTLDMAEAVQSGTCLEIVGVNEAALMTVFAAVQKNNILEVE